MVDRLATNDGVQEKTSQTAVLHSPKRYCKLNLQFIHPGFSANNKNAAGLDRDRRLAITKGKTSNEYRIPES